MKRIVYDKDIQTLIQRVKDYQNEIHLFDSVFPIPRGGYYPAIKIAQALGVNLVLDKSEITQYTLVVDDLCDSGSTIANYLQNNVVAVVYNKQCDKAFNDMQDGKPLIFAKEIEIGKWVKFPDEHESTVEENIQRIFQFIGEDVNREGLKGTPERIVRMFGEIFRGYKPEHKPKITTFPNGEDGIVYDSMVLDEGNFYSCCEHHMMPFFGKYWFAYIPNPKGRILGISKIGRVVDYCAARLQVQERLTHDVVDMLSEALGSENPPLGIALVMRGEHLCKTMRGAKKKGQMSSSYLTGLFKTDATLRSEFMRLIQ